jgi:hypothetical protein
MAAKRSDAWFHDPDMYGFVRRAFAKSMSLDDADLARPIIGIAQTQSDLNNCNNNFRELAEYVKRGVWQAGGTPLDELGRRRLGWQSPVSVRQARGYTRMYVDHVLQAGRGADFDFLVGGDQVPATEG